MAPSFGRFDFDYSGAVSAARLLLKVLLLALAPALGWNDDSSTAAFLALKLMELAGLVWSTMLTNVECRDSPRPKQILKPKTRRPIRYTGCLSAYSNGRWHHVEDCQFDLAFGALVSQGANCPCYCDAALRA